jgi:hypothetical protein
LLLLLLLLSEDLLLHVVLCRVKEPEEQLLPLVERRQINALARGGGCGGRLPALRGRRRQRGYWRRSRLGTGCICLHLLLVLLLLELLLLLLLELGKDVLLKLVPDHGLILLLLLLLELLLLQQLVLELKQLLLLLVLQVRVKVARLSAYWHRRRGRGCGRKRRRGGVLGPEARAGDVVRGSEAGASVGVLGEMLHMRRIRVQTVCKRRRRRRRDFAAGVDVGVIGGWWRRGCRTAQARARVGGRKWRGKRSHRVLQLFQVERESDCIAAGGAVGRGEEVCEVLNCGRDPAGHTGADTAGASAHSCGRGCSGSAHGDGTVNVMLRDNGFERPVHRSRLEKHRGRVADVG